MHRLQFQNIIKDLEKKMVFVAGPRQVGKTFLAKQAMSHYQHPVYLNYDHLPDRAIIQEQAWLPHVDLIIFDELHKRVGWKNYLKGVYDTKPDHLHILVTGSARFDIYHRVGDSLAGRYFLHHLFPLSPAELHQLHLPFNLEDFMKKGNFPEPFLAENEIEANRWRQQYSTSILTGDVFDFNYVQNINALTTLFELLRLRVGSPISYQSLSRDLNIAPNTVKRYIEILEALYVIFRVTPFSKNIARSLLKEPKIYFFDSGLVKDEGAALENFTAVCLLKHVYGKIDYCAEPYKLHYLRTKDGAEVDFALIKGDQIENIIEVKVSNGDISPALYEFNKKYQWPSIQIVKNLRQERTVEGISVLKIERFLKELFL